MTLKRILLKKIVRVAIIGSGVSGIITLSKLVNYNRNVEEKLEIVVFEKRKVHGGIWVYDNLDDINNKPDDTISPIYDNLHTNLPFDTMKLNDFDKNPKNTFPHRIFVKEYIDDFYFSKNLESYIKFNTEVIDLQWSNECWKLTYKEGEDNKIDNFDFIFCCIGNYSSIFIPNIKGLEEFKSRHPDKVIHSKFYRNNKKFVNKSVLIIGNGPSGLDICREISMVSDKVYNSINRTDVSDYSPFPFEVDQEFKLNYKVVPKIKEIKEPEDKVIFEDQSSVKIPDYIIFATGYNYVFPFLNSKKSNLSIDNPDESILEYDSKTFRFLSDLSIYIPRPTIVFIGLPFKVSPFKIFEYQSSFIVGLIYLINKNFYDISKLTEYLKTYLGRDYFEKFNKICNSNDCSNLLKDDQFTCNMELGLKQVEYQDDLVKRIKVLEKEFPILKRIVELDFVTNNWIELRKNSPILRFKELGY